MNSDDKVNYIADMVRQLEALADEAGRPKLAYLLRLVATECEIDDPSALPRIEKDSSGLPN